MKIALINDTSVVGHYGCAAVVDVIERLFESAGSKIAYRHPVGVDWRAHAQAISAIERADAVVVNGEGSIHHGSKRARMLAAIAPYCAERCKPCYLINATLQDNDESIAADLRKFTYAWVRESASSSELVRQGVQHSICPDLAFLQTFRPSADRRGETFVVDSVVPAALGQLANFARTAHADLTVMKRHSDMPSCLGAPFDLLTDPLDPNVLRQPLRDCPDYSAFAGLISSHERLLTGRFHSVCFAIVLRTPFHAFPSNTHKIEATLHDIGLDSERLLAAGDPMPAPRPFLSSELGSIETYLRRARSAADRMIERICFGAPTAG